MQTLHDQKLLAPSKLPPARQEALRAQLLAALARDRQGVPVALHFRSSKDLGPNAIALPGGSVVITDELVELLHDQPEVLIGVVGHERGHVQHRHGMRDLLQATLLSAGAGLAFGDFSGLLASAPVLLAQLRYSRDFEREADGEAIQVLHANGISPAVMAVLFERLRGERDGGAWPAALGSHPDDDERIETFRKAR
jgi:predicted Zn-dependent protease